MNDVGEKINALLEFKRAYHALSFHWQRGALDLNDTAAIVRYPFHKSFDELDVPGWVDATVKELAKRAKAADEDALTEKDVSQLRKIVRNFEDEIGFLTVEEVEHLQLTLKCLAYNKSIKAFYKHLLDAMPDGPNDTPEQQVAYDAAWERFYETPFIITFGNKSVKIENEATVYNGITDMLKELIDYCL